MELLESSIRLFEYGNDVAPTVNNYLALKKKIKQIGADVEFESYTTRQDGVRRVGLEIARIIVPEDARGKGVLRRSMLEITNAADSEDFDLFLEPTAEFGSSKERLEGFYKSIGFGPNIYRNPRSWFEPTMMRRPKR